MNLTHDDLEHIAIDWLERRGYYCVAEYYVKPLRMRIDVVGFKNGRIVAAVECGNVDAKRILVLRKYFRHVYVVDWQGNVLKADVNDDEELLKEIRRLRREKENLRNTVVILRRNLMILHYLCRLYEEKCGCNHLLSNLAYCCAEAPNLDILDYCPIKITNTLRSIVNSITDPYEPIRLDIDRRKLRKILSEKGASEERS